MSAVASAALDGPARTRADLAIATTGLSKQFDTQWALDQLDLRVHRGEVLALLGPNGAGKTTTVRLLNGVLAATRGAATVLGLDPATDGHELRRHTGVLTEHAGLDDRLTTRENLEFTTKVRGFTAADGRRRVDELLERFGMAELADVQTIGFSTGQRKRVALVRALLHDPELLFLDEPTSGLDPAGSREVVALIEQLVREEGRTVVLCTHFLGEAGRLADRMAFLDHGVLRAFGRPAQLAAELWSAMDVEVDLAQAADEPTLEVIRSCPGVSAAHATGVGASIVVDNRAVVPQVVRALGAAGVDLYGLRADPPSLEDVYFALETQVAADPAFRLIHDDREEVAP